VNLHLTNGTAIADAELKLIRFMRNEYELYDGISVPQDSTLSLFDILLSIMMNSRLDTANKVQSIWRGRASVERALALVPPSIALQDEDVPWEDLRTLFDAFCAIAWAGPAVATKILYKKRPTLIPIFDSVISIYIDRCNEEEALPRGSTPGTYMIRGMKCFRRLLVGSFDDIQRLRALPEMQAYKVSPLRVLEVLLWIEKEGSGYYQICPNCHGEKAIPIGYGEPSPKMTSDAAKGKLHIGGCFFSVTYPRWFCPKCESKWGDFLGTWLDR